MLKSELETENKVLKEKLVAFENFDDVRKKINTKAQAVFTHNKTSIQAISMVDLNAIFDACGF